MPTLADAPLRKVTLNLYEDDCVLLEKHYGRGWSTNVRETIHTHVTVFIRSEKTKSPRKLGDLDDN